MEETLQLILKEITFIKEEIKGVNLRLDKVEDVQSEIKTDVKEINRKTSVIFDQTAGLTEFQTEVKQFQDENASDLDTIIREVAFVCHKEVETEKDVFQIKKRLELVK